MRMNGKSTISSFVGFVLTILSCLHAPGADPTTKATTAGTPSTNLPPRELKASWRSLATNVAIASVTVTWDGTVLSHQVTRPPGAKTLASDHFTLRPSGKAWAEFREAMTDVEVWKWRAAYSNRQAARGRGADEPRVWAITLDWGAQRVHSAGTNAYPSMTDVATATEEDVMFYRFWGAVDCLEGRPIEVAGEYFAGFEASQLRPSTAPYAGQVWWLSPNKDFNQLYQKLNRKDEGMLRFGGPEAQVRLRGRLVGPGRYGHLNQYEHEFLVDEVLDMKLAPK